MFYPYLTWGLDLFSILKAQNFILDLFHLVCLDVAYIGGLVVHVKWMSSHKLYCIWPCIFNVFFHDMLKSYFLFLHYIVIVGVSSICDLREDSHQCCSAPVVLFLSRPPWWTQNRGQGGPASFPSEGLKYNTSECLSQSALGAHPDRN